MIDRETAQGIRAWPFAEAVALAERCASLPDKGYVLFETGYGPSGLPHIGTFGEVARTTMVRRAFQSLSDLPTRLFAFSDDMDGLRGVPANIPNRDLVAAHLGKPLTAIPDPYGARRKLRGGDERAAARVPGHVRLRLRVHERHRVLSRRPLRRRAARRARALRRDRGGDTADARRRTARELQPVPANMPGDRRRAAGAAGRARRRRRDRELPRRRGQARGGAGHRWPLQAAMEGRLGDALGGAGCRLRDGRQGPARFRQPLEPHLQNSRRRPAAGLHL